MAPDNKSFGASGGTGNVSVTTTNGCVWTAVGNASRVTITAGASGSGNGAVGYSVAAIDSQRDELHQRLGSAVERQRLCDDLDRQHATAMEVL
jgi:hypothetical protein